MREGETYVRLGLGNARRWNRFVWAVTCSLQNDRVAFAHRPSFGAGVARPGTRGARSRLSVTCEVTPHHFTLVIKWSLMTHFKMNPPLASVEDREALLVGLADGTVDAIATDHAPHEPASEAVEFDRAPFESPD